MTSLSLVLSFFLMQEAPQTATAQVPPVPAPAVQGAALSTYTLGPGDVVVIFSKDVAEIDNRPLPIDMRGAITLPLVGRIQAAGMTTYALETEIETRLKKYLVEPDVAVSVTEMRSQPVSVIGSVQTPGVHQLQGQKTLFEVLSLAGGLRPDAGYRVNITRKLKWGRIPLESAGDDTSGQFSVAAVSVKDIMSAANPAVNILIKPEDVISVPRADIIYVIGAVNKSGGFVMNENETLGTLQVLALAEGLGRAPATANAKIMRTVPGTNNRAEIPVDLKKILAGKIPDVPLKADDILFVPTSAARNAALRATEAAIQIGTGVAIFRR